ncbi:MAG: hypothetical protein AAFX53_10555 [Bacteroidota bacterium]
MDKQNCRVGATNSIANANTSISVLEYQYQHFMDKAAMDVDKKLRAFFELKAQKIKKTLESLV